MNAVQQEVIAVAAAMKVKPDELVEKARAMMQERKTLAQTIEKYKSKEALGEAERVLFSAKPVGEMRVLTAVVPEADANRLRSMGDFLRDKEPRVVGVLASVAGEKITFLAVCGKEAVKAGVKAGDVIKTVTAICGGKGGGKPDSAMGGGTDLLKLDDALAAVDDFVSVKLGL